MSRILVDTSVWIGHLRRSSHRLAQLLYGDQVLIHPCVVGEIACGNLFDREEILNLLSQLPAATEATHQEVMVLVESRRLFGRGVGWIDCHLLASALLTESGLWTDDRRLAAVAADLNLPG